jgi:hypothetical protein
MHPLAPSEVLDLCDRGRGRSPTSRALLLLAAAKPDTEHEDLLATPLGERDRCLLQLRALTLGQRLEAVAFCPACSGTAEIDLDSAELQATGEALPKLDLHRANLRLSVRPVASGDLLAAETCGEVEAARRVIAERCLLGAWRGEESVPVEDLEELELQGVAEALAKADPGAELILELRCPACRNVWRELLDVAAFFWAEVESRSRRVLLEVHTLARGYGWREADILALSSHRRRQYLELLGA